MHYRPHTGAEAHDIVALFRLAFTDSEGEAEGSVIAKLAQDLFDQTDPSDLINFVAEDDGRLAGSIFFTRLVFDSPALVYLLAPVAVHPDHQRQGIGQSLIRFGLAQLRTRGVSAALTYGDPAFYGRVGFRPIDPSAIAAPFELSQPEGWLGQSLVGDRFDPLLGRGRCVEALNDPAYW